jgi:hypothetical protein
MCLGASRRGDHVTCLDGQCVCRKLNPSILMVQSAENWCRQNASNDLNSPRYGRVLAQRQMRACAVVIVHVRTKYVAQMSLAEHDDMIETFVSDRTD